MNSESAPTDPSLIALSALATWRGVDDALTPIIGRHGVAGLYKRSLSLTRVAHPSLTAVFVGPFAPSEYDTLRQALAGQSASVATAASDALLQCFRELLTKLVGASLTAHLLPQLLNNISASGDAVRDTSNEHR